MSDTDLIEKITAEIARANATKLFTVRCTACAESFTKTFSWLQARRFICPSCAGSLDNGPLHLLTLSVMRELRSRAKTPKKRAVAGAKPAVDKPFDTAKCYQLVLQFHGDSLEDFDAMVALEDDLTKQLGNSADVDGHDCGSGETNIFIFTSDPAATFRRAKPVLESRQQLRAVTAAYREVEGESYTMIWPEGSTGEFRIT